MHCMDKSFYYALNSAEFQALCDLDNRSYCVVFRYGTYFPCLYGVAVANDYEIICVTI